MDALRAPDKAAERFEPPAPKESSEPRSAACLNCGTALAGPFCSACGQRDIPPYPSVRELVIDAFWELSGWDGRFLATVRKLLVAPGALTRDFLEGRRARYLSPLRLYLMASLLYFVVDAAAPKHETAGAIDAGGVRIGLTARDVDSASTAGGSKASGSRTAQRDSELAQITKAPRVLQPMLRRIVTDPDGFKRSLTDAVPRALFALLPVFAAIVALFYWGRKYPEHLYFAVHLHAFVFVALTLSALARFTHVSWLEGLVGLGVTLWIPIYATIAFRRTYGGTVGGTVAKEIGIGILYSVAGLAALMAALMATLILVAFFG